MSRVHAYRSSARPVRSNGKSAEHNLMEKLLSDLSGHTLAWPFQQPVNADEVPDYYEVIKQPMGTCPILTHSMSLLNSRSRR